MYIDPQVQKFLDDMAAASSGPPPASLDEQRAGFSALWRSLAPPTLGVYGITTDVATTGPRPVECLIYTPRASDDVLPVLVFYHGGGCVTLSPEDFDATNRMLALHADCIVVVPRYHRAPENPFPGPLEDCFAVYKWVLENASSWGGDATRVAISGDSAGGYLAAAVAQEAKRMGAAQPKCQALIYPMLDMASAAPSRYDRAYWLSDAGLKGVIALHCGDAVLNPRASPLREEDLTGLAPALIITSDLDPLEDEGAAYAHRLRAAGVSVSYFCYQGMVHGFFSFGGKIDEGNRAVAHVASYIRHAFS
jgi:acetyl esterase